MPLVYDCNTLNWWAKYGAAHPASAQLQQHAACQLLQTTNGALKSIPWTLQMTTTQVELKAACLLFVSQAFSGLWWPRAAQCWVQHSQHSGHAVCSCYQGA